MTAQTVLSEKQSTYGGPYGFYTVTLTPSNRTKNSVDVKVNVKAHLQYDASYHYVGVTCKLYIGGEEHEIVLAKNGYEWEGTTPISVTKTITVNGLTVAQTVISGIKFKATSGGGATDGPSLKETACADLAIDLYGGFAHLNVDGEWKQALFWLNVDGEWKLVLPWVRVGYTWRCYDRVIEVVSDLVELTEDGNGNVGLRFAETATVEHGEGGNVKIAANCFRQKGASNIEIL